MSIDEYIRGFKRWIPGTRERRDQLVAELEEHLRSAELAGEIENAMERLGTPRDAARTFAGGYDINPAPRPRRVAAATVDFSVFLALLLWGTATGDWQRGDDWRGWVGLGGLDPLAYALLGAAFAWWVVALTLLEWRTGRTLGKALVGLRVVSEDGTAPSFGQIVVRRLTLVFSGPLQLIDWAFLFLTVRHQRAFDIVAKTIVVHDRPTQERFQLAAEF